jgi:hypothetical protein
VALIALQRNVPPTTYREKGACEQPVAEHMR